MTKKQLESECAKFDVTVEETNDSEQVTIEVFAPKGKCFLDGTHSYVWYEFKGWSKLPEMRATAMVDFRSRGLTLLPCDCEECSE